LGNIFRKDESIQKGVLDCDLIAASEVFEGSMASVLSTFKFSEKGDS